MSIVEYPADVLRQTSIEILDINESIRNLANNMINAMSKRYGIGLAAPQIGILLRMIIVAYDGNDTIMINPEIIHSSEEQSAMMESCLSIPGKKYLVSRPQRVTVAYTTIEGNPNVVELSGISAKCVQHEIDHLNGVLILDHTHEENIKVSPSHPYKR